MVSICLGNIRVCLRSSSYSFTSKEQERSCFPWLFGICKSDIQSLWTLGNLPTVWCELKSLSSVVDAAFPWPTSFPVRPLLCVHERRAVHLWSSLWGLRLLYLPGNQCGRKCPCQGSAGSGNWWVSGITVHPTQQMASLEIIVKKTPSNNKPPEREHTQYTRLFN